MTSFTVNFQAHHFTLWNYIWEAEVQVIVSTMDSSIYERTQNETTTQCVGCFDTVLRVKLYCHREQEYASYGTPESKQSMKWRHSSKFKQSFSLGKPCAPSFETENKSYMRPFWFTWVARRSVTLMTILARALPLQRNVYVWRQLSRPLYTLDLAASYDQLFKHLKFLLSCWRSHETDGVQRTVNMCL